MIIYLLYIICLYIIYKIYIRQYISKPLTKRLILKKQYNSSDDESDTESSKSNDSDSDEDINSSDSSDTDDEINSYSSSDMEQIDSSDSSDDEQEIYRNKINKKLNLDTFEKITLKDCL